MAPALESSPRIAVRIRELTHRYGARLALDSVTLDIPSGCIFGILGPNGSGKTTLFGILATLLRPVAGTAEVFGCDVRAEAARVRRMLGVAFQHPSLDLKLTCLENLRHHGHLYGLRGGELHRRIQHLLERFGLEDRRGDLVERLSGGLRRRLELAKALLHRPRLLMLDEPATGLDPKARQEVWRDLEALRDDGITLALTTHLMEEADRCDRLAILNQGRVVVSGAPDELRARIGGDVIYLESAEAEQLAARIRAELNVDARAVDHQVRIEREGAHRFVATLFEAFPGSIQTVRIGKPTLEDVFLDATGSLFTSDPEPP